MMPSQPLRTTVCVVCAALLFCTLIPGPAAAQAPSDHVDVRLLTPVSSASREPNRAIAAVTITSPLHVDAAVPAGCLVLGSVAEERRASGATGRAALQLHFDAVQDNSGRTYPVSTRVLAVDNAREGVTPDGVIVGIHRVVALPKGTEGLLLLAAYAHPFVLATAGGVHLARRAGERPEITFGEGTELRLQLRTDLSAAQLECQPATPEMAADPTLLSMVPSWPVSTERGNPPRDSDWINVAFVGTRGAIEQAFAGAGWLTAERNSLRSDVKTFLAVARNQGYRSGPVSRLSVGGLAPSLVFQKQNNTFAKRHHIRLWPSVFTYAGRPVWLGAATHDIGIAFSRASAQFTHRIDGAIDGERAKVIGDLALSGAVDTYTMAERPWVPPRTHRADGAWITTDGRIAIAVLREP